MFRHKLLSLVSFVCLLAPAVASADDFAPPPWSRLSPFAITAEWEFLTPLNPTPPDGPLTNVLTKGSGTAPGGTSATIFGSAFGWGGTSGGNWFFADDGGIRFRVDNVVDLEPVKHLRVQVTSTPGMIMFIDPLVGFNFSATGSTATAVSPSTTIVTGPFGPVAHTLFEWDMRPNPPWEDFSLVILSPGEIRQVVVDTISTVVPEPSTFAWYGLALLTVGLVLKACPRLCKQALS